MDDGPYAAHNKKIFQFVEPGDSLEFKRPNYSHFALSIGDGKVIHYGGEDQNVGCSAAKPSCSCLHGKKAIVRMDEFWDVVDKSKVIINTQMDAKYDPLDVETIIAKAKSLLGQENYDLVTNNCEHFVNLCRYGHKESNMVRNFLCAASAVVGTFVLGVGAVLAIVFSDAKSTKKKKKDHDED